IDHGVLPGARGHHLLLVLFEASAGSRQVRRLYLVRSLSARGWWRRIGAPEAEDVHRLLHRLLSTLDEGVDIRFVGKSYQRDLVERFRATGRGDDLQATGRPGGGGTGRVLRLRRSGRPGGLA